LIGFFSILAIGFFLGMRHATDPDHVVAVTTIVSRQSKLSRAALTGLFWGIGHTLPSSWSVPQSFCSVLSFRRVLV